MCMLRGSARLAARGWSAAARCPGAAAALGNRGGGALVWATVAPPPTAGGGSGNGSEGGGEGLRPLLGRRAPARANPFFSLTIVTDDCGDDT